MSSLPYKEPLIKQPREWKGVVLPHHSYTVVPMIPVYDEQEYEDEQIGICTGNEGNIGIE